MCKVYPTIVCTADTLCTALLSLEPLNAVAVTMFILLNQGIPDSQPDTLLPIYIPAHMNRASGTYLG